MYHLFGFVHDSGSKSATHERKLLEKPGPLAKIEKVLQAYAEADNCVFYLLLQKLLILTKSLTERFSARI